MFWLSEEWSFESSITNKLCVLTCILLKLLRITVLLQTAKAIVRNPNGESSCYTRILLDSCSQKSYINMRLKSKLGLLPIATETVLI